MEELYDSLLIRVHNFVDKTFEWMKIFEWMIFFE